MNNQEGKTLRYNASESDNFNQNGSDIEAEIDLLVSGDMPKTIVGRADVPATPVAPRQQEVAPTAPPARESDADKAGKTKLVTRPVDKDAEHTMLVRPPRKQEGETVASDDENQAYYTTAWLVAVSGPMKGQSFALCQGHNFIGRSARSGRPNELCLPKDPTVSSNALRITYDYKGNMFFVQSGNDASEVSYINDKPLLSPTELKTGDIIALSTSTSVRFVRFVDDQFIW